MSKLFQEIYNLRILSEIEKFHYSYLREAYDKPELSFFDDIFSYLISKYNKKQPPTLLIEKNIFGKLKLTEDFKILSDLFLKNNIKIEAIPKSSPDLGSGTISKIYYDESNQIITFELFNNFLESFLRKSTIYEVIYSLKDGFVHENTHEQQSKKLKQKNKSVSDYYIHSKNIDNRNDHGSDDNDSYFIQKVESDSYARGIAQILLDSGMRPKEILDCLQSKEGAKTIQMALQDSGANHEPYFWKFYKIKNKYPKAWKNFIVELYNYLV